MTKQYDDSIFWVDVDKISPNPFQPRREFNQNALEDLADSIKQYGILQPLVVTRHETTKEDGGMETRYELIAGERRLRAAKIGGIKQVPVIIRVGADDKKMKMELAIIENLQREDLNPVEKAEAFQKFIDDFGYKHHQIAKKIGKSREYVSNNIRLLALPEEIKQSLRDNMLTEGHARPMLMLKDKPEEQMTLFKEVLAKKMTVRDTETVARKIAKDKIRKFPKYYDDDILENEKVLTKNLGTRVQIEPREVGGKIVIDFFDQNDLRKLLEVIKKSSVLGNEPVVNSQKTKEKIEELLPVSRVDKVKQTEPENNFYNKNKNADDVKKVSFDKFVTGRKTQKTTANHEELSSAIKGLYGNTQEKESHIATSSELSNEIPKPNVNNEVKDIKPANVDLSNYRHEGHGPSKAVIGKGKEDYLDRSDIRSDNVVDIDKDIKPDGVLDDVLDTDMSYSDPVDTDTDINNMDKERNVFPKAQERGVLNVGQEEPDEFDRMIEGSAVDEFDALIEGSIGSGDNIEKKVAEQGFNINNFSI